MEFIQTSHLTHSESWQWKMIEYPMEAISLNYSQWHSIFMLLIQATIPKAGLVQTFPHDVIFAPENRMGLNLPHPFHLQFLKQIKLILNIPWMMTATKSLLIATAEYLRLEAGWTGTFDRLPMDSIKCYLTMSWWRDLLEYCQAHNLKLIDPLPTLQPHTINDQPLMESFWQHGFRKRYLRRLNTCWVIFLSDICTLDGLQIEPSMLAQGNSTPQPQATTSIHWPCQPEYLAPHFWKIWNQAISNKDMLLSGQFTPAPQF